VNGNRSGGVTAVSQFSAHRSLGFGKAVRAKRGANPKSPADLPPVFNVVEASDGRGKMMRGSYASAQRVLHFDHGLEDEGREPSQSFVLWNGRKL